MPALVLAGLVLISRSAGAQTKAMPRQEPATPASAAVQVRASVDRTAIWVGDRVTYTIDIVCRRGVEILLDDLAKEKLRVNGLDIVSSDSATTTDASERTAYRLRYVLSTYRFDVPSLSIEPISARYYERRPGQRLQDIAPAGEVQIPGAVIAFRSTLPDQPAFDVRDGRAPAPRRLWFARADSIGLALVVVSLAPAVFLGVALLRRRARKTGRRSARQVRLDQRSRLERLRSLDVTTDEDRRRAYDEISAAVRQHLAATTGLPATGLTAAEIAAALESGGSASTCRQAQGRPEQSRGAGLRGDRVSRESVAALLASCDAVRYGPPQALPSPQMCRDALATAEQVLAGK